MSTSSPTDRKSASSGKLKVFLSYSRTDGTFAQELVGGLELLGFDVSFDRDDIAAAEPFEERLHNLIRSADTVVFIISPHSIASPNVAWEVAEAERAGKRLVPVVLSEVPDEKVPARLRRLNYVFFTNGRSFSKGLGELASALRADAGWIREHTRYGELANRWIERDKSAALLLRGTDLDDAKRWAVTRPADAPEIFANQQAYIEASAKAAEEELAAKARLRSRMLAGLALASFALAAFAGFSLFLWQAAETAKESLAKSNARLERKLALRAAPRGYAAYDVPAGWFQVATSFAGAVAFVERRSEPSRLTASGVLVNARLLNPRWEEKPVFVTAIYVVAQSGPGFAPAETQIVMLGPKNERRTARLGAILWQSDRLGVSVSSIEDPLPGDVEVMNSVNPTPTALAGLDVIASDAIDALFDDNAMLKDQKEPRPIVFMGNLQGRNEVAISISHLLGAMTTSRPGDTKMLSRSDAPHPLSNVRMDPQRIGPPVTAPNAFTRDINPVPVSGDVQPDLLYTHATLPGGGGSPIFDAQTGDLIGIHLIGYRCRQPAPAERRCAAAGTSFPRLVAAIRAG